MLPTDLNATYLKQVFAEHGYPLRKLVVFGVRLGPAGTYDDVLGYIDGDVVDAVAGTTDPGLPWLVSPMNPKGCGAIIEGFYEDLWTPGVHSDKPALVQCGYANVDRDNDRNNQLDLRSNIFRVGPEAQFRVHRGGNGVPSRPVGKNSAGCWVPARAAWMDRLLARVPRGTKVDAACFGSRDFPGLRAA